ncbi:MULTISPECIES: hypothetical protein [unclassified Moorena]|uniref:hypothetical protein n=1 Tax=unclassified Moorena TaxID=2683338 RepID=UPI0013FED538|nr:MULTISPECIES: hypothetical protein [unclassified Moorena]NEQ04106.1 hypothetical protein [Moorena sp. SIO3F7]
MQSLMGETTAVAHGGNPQDRAAFPRPRCIASTPDAHSTGGTQAARDCSRPWRRLEF